MKVFYDKDADLSIVQGCTVAIIGYGSQGHAHANNLKESGVSVVVGLRAGSASEEKAREAGIEVAGIGEATAAADIVMVLAPDEHQSALYAEQIEPNLRQGATLAFRARVQHSFRTNPPARGLGCDHDRSERPWAPSAFHLQAGVGEFQP